MARKVTISFKETKKDIKLFNKIMELDDKSHDIKEILYKKLIDNKEESPKRNEKKENDCNLLDF